MKRLVMGLVVVAGSLVFTAPSAQAACSITTTVNMGSATVKAVAKVANCAPQSITVRVELYDQSGFLVGANTKTCPAATQCAVNVGPRSCIIGLGYYAFGWAQNNTLFDRGPNTGYKYCAV